MVEISSFSFLIYYNLIQFAQLVNKFLFFFRVNTDSVWIVLRNAIGTCIEDVYVYCELIFAPISVLVTLFQQLKIV